MRYKILNSKIRTYKKNKKYQNIKDLMIKVKNKKKIAYLLYKI